MIKSQRIMQKSRAKRKHFKKCAKTRFGAVDHRCGGTVAQPGKASHMTLSDCSFRLFSNSWNWCKAPAKNLSKFVSEGGHILFGLILAALLRG